MNPAQPQPRHLKSARRWLANAIWAVAHRVYPYAKHEPSEDQRYYEMDATFYGTEAEADEVFDRLTSLTCENDSPLHDCRFVVGGMRWVKDEDDEPEQPEWVSTEPTTTGNGSVRYRPMPEGSQGGS
jgi:hypothetical protein